MADEEWGPWVEHDGKGCPCVGMFTQWEIEFPRPVKRIIGVNKVIWHDKDRACLMGILTVPTMGFRWSNFGRINPKTGALVGRVVRYRTKKPKGLVILEQLLQELPVKQPKVYHDIEV
jgi:hypothetical protein